MNCLVCGNRSHQGIRNKYRICEFLKAKQIIRAAKHFQDDTFTRIADRLRDTEEDSIKSVIAADFFCHKNCSRAYTQKYKNDIADEEESSQTDSHTNMKDTLLLRACPMIDSILDSGDCCTISDIVEFTYDLLEEGEVLENSLRNHDMKSFILSKYGGKVTITPNSRANESDIFHSSKLTASDLLIKIKKSEYL